MLVMTTGNVMSADAIVMITMSEIVAYGTAVVLEPVP